MSEAELTIPGVCQTCLGGGGDWSESGYPPFTYGVDCPTCKGGGTVRVAVSCVSCLWAERQGDFGDLVCTAPDHNGEGVMSTFGCTDWTSSSDAVIRAIDASGRVTVDRARFERLLKCGSAVDYWCGAKAGSVKAETGLVLASNALQPSDLDPLP